MLTFHIIRNPFVFLCLCIIKSSLYYQTEACVIILDVSYDPPKYGVSIVGNAMAISFPLANGRGIELDITVSIKLGNFIQSCKFSCRFRVNIEMIKPDKLDGATTLKGLQYIDVPGQMKKDYKIDFYAHKEGTFSAKVHAFVW